MGIADTNKLTSMIKSAPGLSAGVGNNIASVQSAIDELTDQRSAVENGLCGTSKSRAITYIEDNILPLYPGGYIVYGANFGQIEYEVGNIADWAIYINVTPPLPAPPIPVPTLAYAYTPGDYPELDTMVDDYAFGNDQLTRPLTSGATYGIIPNIETLNDGKDILQENKDKLDAIPDIFSRYAT
jgi:hypothetical protein